MNQRRPLVALAIVCAALPLAGVARAQDASPAAGTPAPAPLACTAEPRNLDELLPLWFDAAGTPVATPAAAAQIVDDAALPAGKRADDATVQAITALTQEWVLCSQVLSQNARAFSLMTDNLAAQYGPDLANPGQDTPAEVRVLLEAQIAATPVALPQISQIPGLAGPRKTETMDDGRVAAIWSFGGDKALLIYKQVDGKWLIDDVVDILEAAGTPVAATPAP